MDNFTLKQGFNGNWFVRSNTKLIAGFTKKPDAELFLDFIQAFENKLEEDQLREHYQNWYKKYHKNSL